MAGSLVTNYLAQGAAASRPAAPTAATGTLSFYFATDTETLSFYDWNDAAWQDLATAGTASTTEVLTGTDTAKSVTPDALAALWEKGSDIASAGTISVGEGGFFDVTGTTAITDIDFATDKSGRLVWLQFDDSLTLTHSSTLIMPGGVNHITQAGDVAVFVSEGTADTVRCLTLLRAKAAAPLGFLGTRVKKAADQTTANYTSGAVVAWDGEYFDVGTWHDTVTNNSRITVPASLGITYIELFAQVGISGATATADRFHGIWITKNGAVWPDVVAANSDVEIGGTNPILSCASGPVAATAGDYFEVTYLSESDTSVTIEADSSFFAARAVG